jgi:hypothetical protein
LPDVYWAAGTGVRLRGERRHSLVRHRAGISGFCRKESIMLHAPRSTASLMLSLAIGLAALLPSPQVRSQEAPHGMVSIYRVAPGKHLEFLRWQAARDAATVEAGLGPTQWYAHLDGDSWDYVGIAPARTEAQDDQVDAILKRNRLTTGFKASLEFRTMIAYHTDTYAIGPTTAAALIDSGK